MALAEPLELDRLNHWIYFGLPICLGSAQDMSLALSYPLIWINFWSAIRFCLAYSYLIWLAQPLDLVRLSIGLACSANGFGLVIYWFGLLSHWIWFGYLLVWLAQLLDLVRLSIGLACSAIGFGSVIYWFGLLS